MDTPAPTPLPLCVDQYRHLLTLMQASEQGFALFDHTDTLQLANTAFRRIFGLTDDLYPSWIELMRMNHAAQRGTHVEAHDFEVWLRSAQSRRGKLPFRTIESDLVDGRWLLTTETTLPNGWMLCVMTDVSELGRDWRSLRHERDQARKSSLSDELTGLSNRRHALEYLHRNMGPHKVVSTAAVMLDIDHFKRVNDTYGHDIGDQVLKHFASVLQTHVRRDDIAARWGGEEFVLLLPGMAPEHATAMLERLFERIRSAHPLATHPTFAYTCSAGVAFARPGETGEALLKRADEALYEGKQSGRDRYKVAQD